MHDNLWNARSDSQKLEALNVLSFHFKQTNDNLDKFSNPSSSVIHCVPMDTDLENFICRKQKKISKEESTTTFSKFLQNEFPKLSEESLEFQKSRFSFYKQKILNLSQDLRQIISLKAQATEVKQKHIMQFFFFYYSLFCVTILRMSFI